MRLLLANMFLFLFPAPAPVPASASALVVIVPTVWAECYNIATLAPDCVGKFTTLPTGSGKQKAEKHFPLSVFARETGTALGTMPSSNVYLCIYMNVFNTGHSANIFCRFRK